MDRDIGDAPGMARTVEALVRRTAADMAGSPAIAALLAAGAALRHGEHGGKSGTEPLWDVDVLEAARIVSDLRDGRALAATLSSGARAIAWRAGEVHIEGDELGPASSDGPSREPEWPEPSFLRHLRRELARRMPEVVAPSRHRPWCRRHEKTRSDWLRLRAPTLAEATSFEIEVGPNATREHLGQTERAAAEVVDRLVRSRTRSAGLAEPGAVELRRARLLARELVGTGAAFEVVEAVVALDDDVAPRQAGVAIRSLDQALRIDETTIATLPGDPPLSDALETLAARQRHLSGILLALRGLGGDCWICPMALAAIDASTMGRAEALHQISRSLRVHLDMPPAVRIRDVSLCWQDGTIMLEGNISHHLYWARDRLAIRDVDLPDTVLAALPGRRLEAVVDLPFPVPQLTVTGTHRGDYLYIAAAAAPLVGNLARGTVIA